MSRMRKSWGYAVAALMLGAAGIPLTHDRLPPRADTDAPPARGAREGPGGEREDGALERAQYFLAKRLPPGETRLDTRRWFAAEQRMRAMRRHLPERMTRAESGAPHTSASLTSAPTWEWLGPANAAGRMRTLTFHPQNPDVLFGGGVSGGVWRSDDAGANWRPLSDDAVNLNIGALLIDAGNPDVMYAGTGELYRNSGMPWSPMAGAGIIKSLDGGQSWAPLVATQNDQFRYVSDLVASPHDARRLYAATSSGVWRSDDAGAHFVHVLRPADDANQLLYEGCTDLAIRSDTPGDWLLATCASRSTADRYWLPDTVTPPACGSGPCAAAVFLNTDAAGNGAWGRVLSESAQGRTQLSIHRANQNVIYAVAASIAPGFDRNGDGVGDYNNALHAVFRSDDGGINWHATLRNNDSDLMSASLFQFHFTVRANLCDQNSPADFYGAGWYNNSIAADPLNSDVLWVGGMTVFRSDDGGHHFGLASYYYSGTGVGQSYVHPDQHALVFDPRFDGAANQRLYSTNDGGVAVTDNARAPVSTGNGALCLPRAGDRVLWREVIRGLGTTQFYAGAVTPDGHGYLGGTQDNGTWLGRDNSGPYAWQHIYGGDGGFVAVDPDNPQRLYATAQYVSIGRSENGGVSFVDAITGLNDATLFIMPYLIDPNASSRLWAGGTRLWRSDDRADHWRAASANFDGSGFGRRISAIAVASGNANRMLVGNQSGIFRSDSALASTSATTWNGSAPRTGWVSRLAFDPFDANVAYATYSTFGGIHVWKTTDAGASWQALDGSGDGTLPDVPVHAIAVDPGNTRKLYLGTDLGLFVSLDGGVHWAVENSGFANVIVEDLVVNAPPGGTPQLYAFTYGRGVWRTPLTQLTGAADAHIDARTTGMWVTPAQDGHGFVLEVIPLDGVATLVASWFVYDHGTPLWLIGVGRIDGATSHVVVNGGNGASFPPAFDAAAVHYTQWGTLDFELDSDHSGVVRWNSTLPGFGSGELPITQLLRADLPNQDPAGAVLRACHSGNWYDPQQNGHGFFLDVFHLANGERQLMAVWYVYDHGAPLYLVGAGPINGDRAHVTLGISRGPQFPPAYRVSDLQREAWGTADFRFLDTNHASMDWTPQVAGFPAGHIDLTRLTTQLGRSCD